MTSYERMRVFFGDVAAGADAEEQGFIDASVLHEPSLEYFPIPRLYFRYKQGFELGKDLLKGGKNEKA